MFSRSSIKLVEHLGALFPILFVQSEVVICESRIDQSSRDSSIGVPKPKNQQPWTETKVTKDQGVTGTGTRRPHQRSVEVPETRPRPRLQVEDVAELW